MSSILNNLKKKKDQTDIMFLGKKQNNSLNNEKSYSEIPADQKPQKVQTLTYI